MKDVGIWLERLVFLLPQLVGLWEAAQGDDEQAQLEAQLALTRRMKDRQAREEIGG